MPKITNTQLIEKFMEYSDYGALSQVFVMEALDRYAKEVRETDETEWPENHIINFHAWQGCAAEFQELKEKNL